MTKLHIITHCETDWLVGIDGKDITRAKTSGSKSPPIFAISADEIEKAPRIKQEVPCKKCGELVVVKLIGDTDESLVRVL